MSLRTRIALLSAGAVAVTVMVMLVVTLWFARTQALAELDEQLEDRADAAEIGRDIDNTVIRKEHGFEVEDVLVQVIDADGVKLFVSAVELPVSRRDVAVARRARFEAWSSVKIEGVNLRIYTTTPKRTLVSNVALMVARPLTEIDGTLTRLRNSMVGVALLGIVGAGLLGFTVAGRSIRPLRKLSGAAVEVADTQDLDHRFEPTGAGELSDLANSFNTMLEALSQSRNQQQQLVADASHELRTPLTSLRTNIEMLLREQDNAVKPDGKAMFSDEERQQLLQDVRLELTDLTELVAEMVALASYEFEEAEAQSFDLAEVVEVVVERYRHRSGREIQSQLQPCTVEAPMSLVQRAVSNLVDNAIKWGPPESPIEVAVADCAVTVRDYGPGIDQRDRAYVFERFYRSPEARSMPGSGLGLAIVAQVAQSVGGSAEVVDTDGAGSMIRLKLTPESPPEL